MTFLHNLCAARHGRAVALCCSLLLIACGSGHEMDAPPTSQSIEATPKAPSIVSTVIRGFGPTSARFVIDKNGTFFIADANEQRIWNTSLADPSLKLLAFENGLVNPRAIAVDSQGTAYVANYGANNILKISPSGAVSYFAGSPEGAAGFADGEASSAKFNEPFGIAVDAQGFVYVADTSNHAIRKISPDGYVSTLAGGPNPGNSDGAGGLNGPARFALPIDLAVHSDGSVFVADTFNQRIRKIAPDGQVSTYAGSSRGYENGQALSAKFNTPISLAIDEASNLYVADTFNHVVRQISADGVVTTLAGTGEVGHEDGEDLQASFHAPSGIAVDASGDVYVIDPPRQSIRKISKPSS